MTALPLMAICPDDAGMKSRKNFQQGALAAAAGSYDGDKFAGVNLERNALQGIDHLGAVGKHPADIVKGD